LALVLTEFINGDDARVIQVGGGLGFGVEPLDVLPASELAGEDHLQGDEAVQPHLPGLVHHAHAATGNFLEELVVPEAPSADRGQPTLIARDQLCGVWVNIRSTSILLDSASGFVERGPKGASFLRRRRARVLMCRRLGGSYMVLSREERAQMVCKVRMLRKQRLPVYRHSAFDGPKIPSDQLIEFSWPAPMT
jgi:hypothetical protein